MTAKTKPTGSPTASEPNAMKPMRAAKASISTPNPLKPQKAELSQAAIAEKAYEIWCSLGQVMGRDQEHWFQAEQQLRQA